MHICTRSNKSQDFNLDETEAWLSGSGAYVNTHTLEGHSALPFAGGQNGLNGHAGCLSWFRMTAFFNEGRDEAR